MWSISFFAHLLSPLSPVWPSCFSKTLCSVVSLQTISMFAPLEDKRVTSAQESVTYLVSCALFVEMNPSFWGSCSVVWTSSPSSVAIFTQIFVAGGGLGLSELALVSSVGFNWVFSSKSFDTSCLSVLCSGFRNCRLRRMMTTMMKKYDEPLIQVIKLRKVIL